MIQVYFFNKEGRAMPQPNIERSFASQVSGFIDDIYNNNWQQAANVIQGIGKPHGSIVKMVLTDENVPQSKLQFFICYDVAKAAKQCYDQLLCVNAASGTATFLDLSYWDNTMGVPSMPMPRQ